MWRSLGLEDKKTRWSCRLNLAPWVLCSMGALLAVGCKYNKPCANGQCAPGQMNAVNSYSPEGYLGSTPSTMPGAQRTEAFGQPVNPGGMGSGMRGQGSGSR